MSTRRAVVHRIATAAPDDVSGLERAIAEGRVVPGAIVAIFGKTEGNGLVNDWTRGLAARALRDLLGRHAGPEAAERVCLVMSGGTEGGLSPHVTVFEVREADEAAVPGARVGSGAVRPRTNARLAETSACPGSSTSARW